MYEEINDHISVFALFKNSQALPYSFSWKERNYKVGSVNFEYQDKRDTNRLFHFSITAEGNNYEISFCPTTLIWKLEKIWIE